MSVFRRTGHEPATSVATDYAEAALFLAAALRKLVNAPLPPDLDLERPFWVAARNARATLSAFADVTGIDGEQGHLRAVIGENAMKAMDLAASPEQLAATDRASDALYELACALLSAGHDPEDIVSAVVGLAAAVVYGAVR